jgi:hypothetical protein
MKHRWRHFEPLTRLALAGLAVATLMAACSFPSSDSTPARSGTARAASPGDIPTRVTPPRTYQIVAPILHPRGSAKTLACDVVLLSIPPAGCSGVPIAGYAFENLPGVIHAAGAWWTVQPFLLIGTWDGHRLVVTRRPVPRRRGREEPPLPSYCRGYATFVSAAFARRITRHRERIHLLSLTPCAGKVWAVVAVADRATRSYLRRHFGTRVLVGGWLRPLPES